MPAHDSGHVTLSGHLLGMSKQLSFRALSNCYPYIFFLPSVADDPFDETDCSTNGIDIDLLYFWSSILYRVLQNNC